MDKEDLILEAICDKGCRTITAIVQETNLSQGIVGRIMRETKSLSDIKEIKKQEDYEVLRHHYKIGMTQKQLFKETGVSYSAELFNRLTKEARGLIDDLFSFSDMDKEETEIMEKAIDIYQTSTKHIKDLKVLYQRVKDISQLRQKDCAKKWSVARQAVRNFIRIYNLEELTDEFKGDALAYYYEHYPGSTRGQLINQNGRLYRRLEREGTIEHVPYFQIFDGDALAYCHRHYPGITRGVLERKNKRLYDKLRRDKTIHHVPLKS